MIEVPSSDAGAVPGVSRREPALQRFLSSLVQSLERDTFVRLVLSAPPQARLPKQRIEGRLVLLRGAPALSLTTREPTRDTVRNLAPGEVEAWLKSELASRFHAALLETTERDWQLALPPDGPPRLTAHRPRSNTAPSREHDHPRNPSLSASAIDWLKALDLADDQGRPRPSRAGKHRQILRYSEILGHLARDCGWVRGATLRATDMGCGRGYLTFAAWQLLNRELGLDAEVVGVDSSELLVTQANRVAELLNLAGLRFTAGTIADVPLPQVDIFIALHACNTATDDAVRRGIAAGATLIIVAPCCHQEIRPQLSHPEVLAPVLEHGLMAERMSEWLTDGLRALFLQWAGYRVRLIEFVGSEHTPKNLLIAGVRKEPPFQNPALRERIVSLKRFFGVTHHALDSLLEP